MWNSDNLMVMLIKGFVFFEVDDDLIGGYWMILDLKVEILIDDGMFFIIYMFMFIRKFKIYIFNIIILMVFLVVLDIFMFIIFNDFGEKLFFFVVLLFIFILMIVVISLFLILFVVMFYLEIFFFIDIGLGILIFMIVVILL